MATDIYERLARHLDDLPAGFPRTESGVEMRILRRLFTPGDAELALHLTLIPEEPRVIARRAKIPVEKASKRLEEMVEKGLVFSRHQENKPSLYMASPFAVGFWEAQVNKLDRELVQNAEEYSSTYLEYSFWRGLLDLHCHAGPSMIPRRIDTVDAARQGEKAGLSAVLVKDHHLPTMRDVRYAKEYVLKKENQKMKAPVCDTQLRTKTTRPNRTSQTGSYSITHDQSKTAMASTSMNQSAEARLSTTTRVLGGKGSRRNSPLILLKISTQLK